MMRCLLSIFSVLIYGSSAFSAVSGAAEGKNIEHLGPPRKGLERRVHSIERDMKDMDIGYNKEIHAYMEGINNNTINPSIHKPDWDKMPKNLEECTEGTDEDFALEVYRKMYLSFIKAKDIHNAAYALWCGSQFAEEKEGNFFTILAALGIKGTNPSLEEILECLQKKPLK